MKKHNALIIILFANMLISPLQLVAATSAQETEANNTLLAGFRQKLKTFHKKMNAYKNCIFGDCQGKELEELQQLGKGLMYTLGLMFISGLIIGGVSYVQANNLLIWGARYNNQSGINAALKLGANVNAQNKFGQTAAMWAAYNGDVQLLNRLKDLGANIELKDDQGQTARDYVQMYMTRTGQQPVIWE